MQALVAKEIESAEAGQVSYEIQWVIPNWREVRRDVTIVRNLLAIFETGQEPTQIIQTKWLVGLKDGPHRNGQRVRVYWQLLDIKGWGSQFKLDAKLKTTLFGDEELDPVAEPKVDEQRQNVRLGEIIEEKEAFLEIGRDLWDVDDDDYINSTGAIEYRLVVTFKTPDNNSTRSLKLEQFSKRSQAVIREKMGTLLDANENGDLKIITSDGVELRAIKSILKVQCPVFAGMLNSDLSEAKSGILKLEDISGKTMKILVHYFYTGDLLNGWNDNDTIVEFTYAAGKYQISQVLELLDDFFGRDTHGEVSNFDVQLLNLAGKLSLKNAEKRLLQRVIKKVTEAKSGEELFQLLGYDSEDITRKAEMLAGDQSVKLEALEVLNYAIGNTNQQENFFHHGVNLLALVHRNGSLESLEKVLVKQIAETAGKFTTAEEIFGFFWGSE